MATIASQIFASLVEARSRAYSRGRLGVARLAAPVVSIGNLRVGGSGKTPCVIALGRALTEAGVRVDVLSRGYRRAARALAIAETGAEPVTEVGDEPRLIAQRLGRPVLVHPDRFRAGLEGERRFQTQLHLLDDGFQHRQLARNFDLVLVADSDLDDRMLPAGRLREPPAALARAHAILWTGAESPAAARARLASFTRAPVFLARKRALPLIDWHGPPAGAAPRRPLAFCGLARPESFWATLAELGIAPAGQVQFRDHHRYSAADLQRLERQAAAAGAGGFITTAKDAANLPASPRLAPLQVVEIEMEIPAMAELVTLVRGACGL